MHADGSLDAVPAALDADTAETTRSAAPLRVPADYVREHVELGYATTIHRAQSQTADTAHLIAAPGLTREALYVAMTRGRHANHAYTATDAPGHHDTSPEDPVPTGRQILAQIMATDGTPVSATATMRRRQTPCALVAAPDALPHPWRPNSNRSDPADTSAAMAALRAAPATRTAPTQPPVPFPSPGRYDDGPTICSRPLTRAFYRYRLPRPNSVRPKRESTVTTSSPDRPNNPMKPSAERTLLTIPQAAEHLGTPERSVRRLIAERRVRFYKVGRYVRFGVRDLDAFVGDGLVEARDRSRR